jgi:hypothetical protein
MIALLVPAGVAALAGAVVADGSARLLLAMLAAILFYEAARLHRGGGAAENSPALDDRAAGAWLLGFGVFMALWLAGQWAILPRIDNESVRFAADVLMFAVAYLIGHRVQALASRSARFRPTTR